MLLDPHDGDSECICRSSNARAATPSLRTVVDYIIDDSHIHTYIYIHMDMGTCAVSALDQQLMHSSRASQLSSAEAWTNIGFYHLVCVRRV